jgi:hypothetical protein
MLESQALRSTCRLSTMQSVLKRNKALLLLLRNLGTLCDTQPQNNARHYALWTAAARGTAACVTRLCSHQHDAVLRLHCTGAGPTAADQGAIQSHTAHVSYDYMPLTHTGAICQLPGLLLLLPCAARRAPHVSCMRRGRRQSHRAKNVAQQHCCITCTAKRNECRQGSIRSGVAPPAAAAAAAPAAAVAAASRQQQSSRSAPAIEHVQITPQ